MGGLNASSLLSSSSSSSSLAASSFVPGSYTCPGCQHILDSVPGLISHANGHVTGLFSAPIASNAFDSLGYEACPRCHKFYKAAGLATHRRSCDKNSLVVVDAVLQEALLDEGDWLPSLEDVFSVFVPTLSAVPTGCQQAWGVVLERALHEVATQNSVRAWTRLLMLPKCVLVASRRAGKRNRGDHLSVSRLCTAWDKGEVKWLWTRATRSSLAKARSQGVDSKRVFESAITHVRHGRLGKACATLSSSGLAPDVAATGQKLRGKHPAGPSPLPVLRVPGDSPAMQLGPEFNLKGVLASFAKNVGTDNTNFRVQHLVDACSASLPRALLGSLRRVINLLLSGEAHFDTQQFLAGAKLTALTKGEDDVRPIAAGNVFRRIASKCVCQLHQARFRAVLGKHQVGVAQPAGAEAVVHLTREVVDRLWVSPDFVLLKVDFANAFNSIDRTSMLRECQISFPDLLPWVEWCYGEHTVLFHSTGKLESCVGVHQGDPLAPLLFCLVLNILVRRVAQLYPNLDLHRWYLDDGALAGSVNDILGVVQLLRLEGPPLGLNLQLGKCELFSSHMDNFDKAVLVDGESAKFPRALRSRSDLPDFVLLGSPFGGAEFCASHVKKLCESNRKLLARITKLEDPQVALHLLRTCASFSKFVYLTRTTPPLLLGDELSQCDNDIREAFASMTALQVSNLAWHQAQLSLARGGLGLRSVAEHAAATYISSHIRALPDLVSPHVEAAVDIFSQQLGSVQSLEKLMEAPPSQRSLSSKLEDLRAASLRDQLVGLADRLRLASTAAPRSAAWLQALPCRGPLDLTLTADQAQVALQQRLGLPLAGPAEKCPLCGKLLDALGHHHVTCSHGDDRNSRHNRLRDALFKLLSAAGMSPEKEQGSFEHDRTRPADVLVPSWSLGKSAAFDLTVVSPLTSDNLTRAGEHFEYLERAAALKHDQNDAKCTDLGWVCVPLAVDTYGQWCDEAHRAFAEIATRLSTRTKVSWASALSSIYNTLGVVLARHNAIAVLARRVIPFSIGAREVLSTGLFPD